jgi:hypothetical protein
MSTLTLELNPGGNPLDDLETLATCYQALRALMSLGSGLDDGELDNIAELMRVLGELNLAAQARARQTLIKAA